MAKNKTNGTAGTTGTVEIRNLEDGRRAYPLTDRTTVHLPGRHRNAKYPVVPHEKVGPILRRAEKKGLVEIVEAKGGADVGAGSTESDMD